MTTAPPRHAPSRDCTFDPDDWAVLARHWYPAALSGEVWTCLRDEGFQRINCPSIDIAAFAGRRLEGFLNVAHFGFMRLDSFGDPDDTVVPDCTPVRHDHGFTVDYWSTASNYPHGSAKQAPPHFPGGGRLNIMNAASPVSARRTRMFAPIARDFDTDQPVQAVYDFSRTVFEEDRATVEVQKPENLPLDPRLEVHIRVGVGHEEHANPRRHRPRALPRLRHQPQLRTPSSGWSPTALRRRRSYRRPSRPLPRPPVLPVQLPPGKRPFIPVLAGEPDHCDEIQTPDERAADNQITICCSRARTPELLLGL